MSADLLASVVERPPIIVSYGGGTNSTALLIELVNRGFPIDAILFADTGGEKPPTYDYVEMFSKWLVSKGYPAIQNVWYTNRKGERVTLEEDCLRKETLPSKAFGYSGCSLKWKIEPQEKWVNNWAPARAVWKAGGKVVKIIGYDADEPERAERRADKDAADPKYRYIYPLINWDWGREECVACIEAAGLPLPGKSACYFCPSMKKPEIVQLAHEHPDLLLRAVTMEQVARDGRHGLDTVKGLGRKFAWYEYLLGLPVEEECDDETACGCYDG